MERTKSFLTEVIEPLQDKYERIMIVGHGAMNKGLMCHILNHGIEEYWSGDLQKNCAFTIVELDDDGYKLVKRNKTFFEKTK